MKSRVLVLTAAALFVTALTASAQMGTWTAVGSTGTVEPTQVGQFGTFGGTRLGFNPAGGSNAGTIIARFNVTNTWGGGTRDTPPWTTLEVGALNTVFDPVAATLYRVDPCTGNRTAICTATNNVAGGTGTCVTCTFANTTFNFANFLYYVEVSITRGVGTGNPQLATLRIR
jgi:hypothetical protein